MSRNVSSFSSGVFFNDMMSLRSCLAGLLTKINLAYLVNLFYETGPRLAFKLLFYYIAVFWTKCIRCMCMVFLPAENTQRVYKTHRRRSAARKWGFDTCSLLNFNGQQPFYDRKYQVCFIITSCVYYVFLDLWSFVHTAVIFQSSYESFDWDRDSRAGSHSFWFRWELLSADLKSFFSDLFYFLLNRTKHQTIKAVQV